MLECPRSSGFLSSLLPTTMFWIVAVWAFSTSSPDLSRKLLELPSFGPALKLGHAFSLNADVR